MLASRFRHLNIPLFHARFSSSTPQQDPTSSTGPNSEPPKKVEIISEEEEKRRRQKPPLPDAGPFLKKPEKKSLLSRIFDVRAKFQNIRSPHPTNFGYANERGIDNYDPEIPMEELIRTAIPETTRHAKMYIKEKIDGEWSYNFYNKPGVHRDLYGLAHGETFVEYDFASDEALDKWRTGCDSDWSIGYSKCDLYRSDRNTAIFEGSLSTRVVKDGKTKKAGFCTMKTVDKLAFNRKRYYQWDDFSHLIVKLRGDGRSYKIMLHSPDFQDVTWGDTHSYPLHTHGGPYWYNKQYERIPFSRFFHTAGGRIQDRQYSIWEARTISSIGIVLMDRIDGPFRLEVAFIGVTHDKAHKEKFAYETYQHPIYNVML